jgi:lactoylglutathione lyase
VTPKEIVQELFSPGRIRRYNDGDETAVDELIAEDMVNHAAGPLRQGREGWKQIIAMISNDLGPLEIENHAFIAEGDLVAHHMTMRGTHQASTMPLLSDVSVTKKPVAWTYIHIWRVVDGKVVEHWACRDDVGLLAQVGAWPPR